MNRGTPQLGRQREQPTEGYRACDRAVNDAEPSHGIGSAIVLLRTDRTRMTPYLALASAHPRDRRGGYNRRELAGRVLFAGRVIWEGA